MTNDEYVQAVQDGVWPEDCSVPLDPPFTNEAGSIQNLVLRPFTSAAIIESRRGAVRSNHYHKSDHHFLFVLSGRLLYLERPVGAAGLPEPRLFGPGSMFFTPPMREHAVLFLENTVLVSLAKNVRDHEHHEDDLVRVPFLDSETASRLLASYS